VIFIDCSIPRGVADWLKRDRSEVMWLGERFELDVRDQVWLREAGESSWLVITHDKKIRRRPSEKRALLESGVGCFILVYRDNLTKEEIYALIVSVLDKMEDLFRDTPRPFIYTVSKNREFKKYASGLVRP